MSGVGEWARLRVQLCECRHALGAGRLDGRHRQATGPDQTLTAWLPALGPDDVAATSALATVVLGQGAIARGNVSNDDSHLPGGSSEPGVLSAGSPFVLPQLWEEGRHAHFTDEEKGAQAGSGTCPGPPSQGTRWGSGSDFHMDTATLSLPRAHLPQSLRVLP